MSRRTLILAAGVGSGHNSAARAIEAELLARGLGGEVRRVDVLDTTNEVFNKLYDDAYFALVAEVPWLVGWGYDRMDAPFKLATATRWFEQANTTSMVREIRDFQPDLVICTHFLPARMVSLMIASCGCGPMMQTLTTVGLESAVRTGISCQPGASSTGSTASMYPPRAVRSR